MSAVALCHELCHVRRDFCCCPRFSSLSLLLLLLLLLRRRRSPSSFLPAPPPILHLFLLCHVPLPSDIMTGASSQAAPHFPSLLPSPKCLHFHLLLSTFTTPASASKNKPLLSINAIQSQPLASPRPWKASENENLQLRRTQRHCVPQFRDTPPKRDTGIASEKEWGINLMNEKVNESGVNEDGSTWYRESGEDLGENGYRCRWTVMGGRTADGLSEWKEAWWEKSDWTGYKELGAEKSGKNAQGDSWWETWQEILRQDEWSNLARIERSAKKQAKSGTDAGWYEHWWEKYNAKGWTEKGAHKYGRFNEQSWWEKWGEQYDGRGSVLKWTDKWAETVDGTKWGDKWEERFYSGMGTRQGETWHSSPGGERWSRTWGEEHFGNGSDVGFHRRSVHKYGQSTSGETWDTVVEENTYYESEPHYGWADAIGNSSQLLAIEPVERPPGVFPDINFSAASTDESSDPPFGEHPS